jgi:hypothetical protein
VRCVCGFSAIMRDTRKIRAAGAATAGWPQRDVRLSKWNCDTGFVEGVEDGDPQIRARATAFVEVVNERVEFEIETVCAEIFEIDGRGRRRHDIGIVLRDFEQNRLDLAWIAAVSRSRMGSSPRLHVEPS